MINMKLQRGRFLIKNIMDLNNAIETKDGIKRVIDLDYMGKFEYEGNAIPISRMFIEYYKENYLFYSTNIFNKTDEEMFIYANSNLVNDRLKQNPNFILDLAKYNINKNYSLNKYINDNKEECFCDFWRDIESDYFIFFGEEKKEIIEYFINKCHNRDGGKEEIKRKLLTVGYKL